MRAAVCLATGDESVEIFDDVAPLEVGPNEVRVQIHSAGLCHSDVHAMSGSLPQGVPMVPGHEGAGEITEVGGQVTSTKVGDHVIVSWTPPCGKCKACLRGEPNLCIDIMFAMAASPRFTRPDGTQLFGMAGTGTWAEEMVLPEQAVVVIPDDVPYEIGALIGCGVTTGFGAAVNTAKVIPGSSVAVIGCGGVGISTIQGARVAGAAEIVAVDTVASKLEDAKRFGATDAAHPDDFEQVKANVTGGEGFDYAFECIGTAPTFRAAYDAVRRGGTAVIVGVGRADQTLVLNGFEMFFFEKKLLGSYYGSADVRTEFHRIIRLWKAGRIDLEGMVTRRLSLEEMNEGLETLRKGEAIRQVVDFASTGTSGTKTAGAAARG